MRKLSKKKTGRKDNLIHLLRMITWLDELRSLRPVDPRKIEEAAKKCGLLEVRREWRMIEPSIEKIAFLPRFLPKMESVIKILSILKICIAVMLVLYFASYLMGLYGNTLLLSIVAQLPIVVMFFVVVISTLTMDLYIKYKMKTIGKSYPKKYEIKRKRIRNAVQNLIYCLVKELKELGIDPSKYKFRLLNIDYEGIKIVRKPTYSTEYYVVTPLTTE